MNLTPAQKRILANLLAGEQSEKGGHAWTHRRMRLAYVYGADGEPVATLPRTLNKLYAAGLIEADVTHAGNSGDTTWRLTEAGRAAALSR